MADASLVKSSQASPVIWSAYFRRILLDSFDIEEHGTTISAEGNRKLPSIIQCRVDLDCIMPVYGDFRAKSLQVTFISSAACSFCQWCPVSSAPLDMI